MLFFKKVFFCGLHYLHMCQLYGKPYYHIMGTTKVLGQ